MNAPESTRGIAVEITEVPRGHEARVGGKNASGRGGLQAPVAHERREGTIARHRIMSHGRGNPDTDVGRSLNEGEDASDRAQQVGPPEQQEGGRRPLGSQIRP